MSQNFGRKMVTQRPDRHQQLLMMLLLQSVTLLFDGTRERND
jgi:hypothetical protein